MIETFKNLHPLIQAFIVLVTIFGITGALAFMIPEPKEDDEHREM